MRNPGYNRKNGEHLHIDIAIQMRCYFDKIFSG